MQTLMASPAGRKWVEQGHNPLAQQRAMGKLIDQFGAQLIREAWVACQDADAIFSSFTSDTYALAIAEKRQMPTLHAVSRHVLPFPADWPDNFHITGYWFLDEDEAVQRNNQRAMLLSGW